MQFQHVWQPISVAPRHLPPLCVTRMQATTDVTRPFGSVPKPTSVNLLLSLFVRVLFEILTWRLPTQDHWGKQSTTALESSFFT